jgi:hypothetical protein
MRYQYTAVVTITAAFSLLSSQAVAAFAAPAISLRSPLKPAFSGTSITSRSSDRDSRLKRTPNGGTNTGLSMVLSLPRGGATIVSTLSSKVTAATSTPTGLFNFSLLTLGLTTAVIKILQRSTSDGSVKKVEKPQSVRSLQLRFLSVFWLIRCADWLQGPYFYEVYASKVFNGAQASMGLVSKLFLTGFASTALFGPLVGRAADTYGRKKGTLAFVLLYSLGAVSTKSPLLTVLLLGRVFSGIGTSLLFSAPESWLVGESQKGGDDPDGNYLGETFGMVCFFSSLSHWYSFTLSVKHVSVYVSHDARHAHLDRALFFSRPMLVMQLLPLSRDNLLVQPLEHAGRLDLLNFQPSFWQWAVSWPRCCGKKTRPHHQSAPITIQMTAARDPLFVRQSMLSALSQKS